MSGNSEAAMIVWEGIAASASMQSSLQGSAYAIDHEVIADDMVLEGTMDAIGTYTMYLKYCSPDAESAAPTANRSSAVDSARIASTNVRPDALRDTGGKTSLDRLAHTLFADVPERSSTIKSKLKRVLHDDWLYPRFIMRPSPRPPAAQLCSMSSVLPKVLLDCMGIETSPRCVKWLRYCCTCVFVCNLWAHDQCILKKYLVFQLSVFRDPGNISTKRGFFKSSTLIALVA